MSTENKQIEGELTSGEELVGLNILRECAEFIGSVKLSVYNKVNFYAIQLNLIVMAEISKEALSDKIKHEYSGLNWFVFEGLRNPLLHQFHWLNEELKNTLHNAVITEIGGIISILSSEENDTKKTKKNTDLLENFIKITESKQKEFQKTRGKKKRERNESKRDLKYMRIVEEEINFIEGVLGGDTELENDINFYALQMSLVSISLSVKEHFSTALKSEYNLQTVVGMGERLTWSKISRIQADLIHKYYEVNKETVCLTCRVDS